MWPEEKTHEVTFWLWLQTEVVKDWNEAADSFVLQFYSCTVYMKSSVG